MMILVLNNILTEVSNFFLPALIFVITTLKIVLLKNLKRKRKREASLSCWIPEAECVTVITTG